MAAVREQKAGYLRTRGWKDLIFLGVVLALGFAVTHHFRSMRHDFQPMSDVEKWKARPKLSPRTAPISWEKPGRIGLDPCLFIVPAGATDQPVVSGSIGDCLMLVPDGRKLDFYEVELRHGDFFHVKTDLYVPDTIPLAFTRTYNPTDLWASRIGSYFRHVYDPYLYGDRNPYTYLRWVLPDGAHLYYKRISPGAGFSDAVYEHPWPTRIFGWSRIAWNGDGWDLSLADGTTYLSPEAYRAKRPQQGSLVGIFNKDGSEVRLSRKPNGDLTEIKSPSGRWIRLTYAQGQISRATDSLGNIVDYTFDWRHRLRTVKDSHGQTAEYAYDSYRRVVKIIDTAGQVAVENSYDADGRVIQLFLPDRRSYHFDYVVDEKKEFGRVDIADPKGEVTRVNLAAKPDKNGLYYTVEKLRRVPGRR